jgi:hypothetical protein
MPRGSPGREFHRSNIQADSDILIAYIANACREEHCAANVECPRVWLRQGDVGFFDKASKIPAFRGPALLVIEVFAITETQHRIATRRQRWALASWDRAMN